jgi:hypothetical protein
MAPFTARHLSSKQSMHARPRAQASSCCRRRGSLKLPNRGLGCMASHPLSPYITPGEDVAYMRRPHGDFVSIAIMAWATAGNLSPPV